jgi:hypothetical protein
MIGSYFFVDTKYFKSSDIYDFPVITIINYSFKNIICLIVILPIMIIILSFMWAVTILMLRYKISSVDNEAIKLCWYFISEKLKIKWINYCISNKKNNLEEWLEQSSEYIQEIIIIHFISIKKGITEENFNHIKNDVLKWTYLESMSKQGELKEWAKKWLQIYIIAERDRKINEILDLN